MSRVFQSHSNRMTVPLLGAVVSIMLHALLLAPVLLGAANRVKPHPDNERSLSRSSTSTDAAMTMIFIDEPESTAAQHGQPPEATASLLAVPNTLLVPIAAPDIPVPTAIALSDNDANDTEEDAVVEASGDDPGRAVMFGRYVGQISARIERAWMRPRTPIESGRFACRARIVQDTTGVVQEVELRNCNGDARWQLSLVRAIQSASPLPAPPNPSVFAKTLILEFSSQSFTPGGDPEGFEPQARKATLAVVP